MSELRGEANAGHSRRDVCCWNCNQLVRQIDLNLNVGERFILYGSIGDSKASCTAWIGDGAAQLRIGAERPRVTCCGLPRQGHRVRKIAITNRNLNRERLDWSHLPALQTHGRCKVRLRGATAQAAIGD